MSAIQSRLRRLEQMAEPQGGRMIVVATPGDFTDAEADVFLKGQGIERRPADLVVQVLRRPGLPRQPRDMPEILMCRDS